MRIRVASVTQNGGGLRVVLGHPLFESGSALKGFTPEGHRLLRVLYKHARTGYDANGRDNSITMGYEAARATAINTRAALQAELDRYANVPMQLRFSGVQVYAAGPKASIPKTMREVREAKRRGCQIQPSIWIHSNLPLTSDDNTRLAAALRAAGIPAAVYGPHHDKEGNPLAVTMYMRDEDKRNPWDLIRSIQPVARRVIV